MGSPQGRGTSASKPTAPVAAMVIKELKQTCVQCHGSGRQAGISQWGITQINPAGRCLTCSGRGFVLTQLGEELVELLRPLMEEMIETRLAAQATQGKKPAQGTAEPD